MSKLSPKLQELLDNFALTTGVPLNVSIKRGISEQVRDSSIERVRRLCTDPATIEYVPISGTLHCKMPLSKISELANLPQVEWVDVEKRRPIEELLD